MKRIGILLFIVGIILLCFLYMKNKIRFNQMNHDVEVYIEQTSKDINNKNEESLDEVDIERNTSTFNKTTINYTAILEIPSIHLKQGVVNSTINFKSIEYAISVDQNSNYPNEKGNFILYAHSGTSYIAYFRNLNKVNLNDDIYIYFNGTKYHYVIYNKCDIKKTGKAKVINSKDDNYITLITCNPNNKKFQIILTGKLIDSIEY